MSNESFASVWDAIEDTPEEARNMKLRSSLMIALKEHLTRTGMSQSQAAAAQVQVASCSQATTRTKFSRLRGRASVMPITRSPPVRRTSVSRRILASPVTVRA